MRETTVTTLTPVSETVKFEIEKEKRFLIQFPDEENSINSIHVLELSPSRKWVHILVENKEQPTIWLETDSIKSLILEELEVEDLEDADDDDEDDDMEDDEDEEENDMD